MQKTFYMNTNLKAHSTRLININLIWRKELFQGTETIFLDPGTQGPPRKIFLSLKQPSPSN